VSVFPVLFDAAPPYLRRTSGARSLLLTPMGSGRLICRLHERFPALGHYDLTVIPTFRPEPRYRQELRRACDQVTRILGPEDFPEFVTTLEPSDWLLFVDPKCTLLDGVDPEVLLGQSAQSPRSAVHIVALETNDGGTREWVDVGDAGDVVRIQRFYDEKTWSYTSGVVASLVPVPCVLTTRALKIGCLRELRTALTMLGVPARDVPVTGHAFDLTQEHELLMMTERVVRASDLSGRANGRIGRDARVHESARLVGPIIVQDGARIGENATVVGPSIIGAGATIGANALVVQCVVQPETRVADRAVVRQRLVSAETLEEPRGARRPERSGYDPSRIRAFRPDLRDEPARERIYPRIKLIVEAAIAIAALIVLSPVLAIVAALIKLESRGPIFFADRREARGGRNFNCLKFRTMVRGADAMQRELMAKNEVDGPQFKLEHDPRVTRVGRWIRPCSLDELPQLINVARGEMSLVGPRPSPFRENQTCIPWREGRLSVRPGITGLWQVCRHDRDVGDFHQWIYYDLLYVQHMSALLDLKIVLATIVTLGGKLCVPLTWIIPRRRMQQPSQ
jgi:lipopolysaccharide/colanic/teichoic acid biosynthesis glycosyltransferase/acetyltransferase-like isoleucine patch superfamily enzyme